MVSILLTAALSLVMSQHRGLAGPPKRDTTKTVHDFVARWVDTAKVGANFDPVWLDLCSLAVEVPDSIRGRISRTRHPGGKEGGKFVLLTDREGFVVKANYLDRRRTESTDLDRTADFAGLRLRPAFRMAEITGRIAWEQRGVLRRLEFQSSRDRITSAETPLPSTARISITRSTLDSLDSAVVKSLRVLMDSVHAVRERGRVSTWMAFPSPLLDFQFGPDGKLVYLRLEEYFAVLKPYPLWMRAALQDVSYPASGTYSPLYSLDYLTGGLNQIPSSMPMMPMMMIR